MAFLAPVGALLGGFGAVYVGKALFTEFELQGQSAAVSSTPGRVKSSTYGACIGAGVFASVYIAQLASLRRLSSVKALSRPETGKAQKSIDSLPAFMADVGPAVVQHAAALTVATIAAGFSKGYADGALCEQMGNNRDCDGESSK